MIELIDIKKSFNGIEVLNGVSFRIEYGETVGIMGSSGCGKTTLAKIITCLIKPSSGRVLYRGDDVFRLKSKALKKFRRKVQIVFQDPFASLDPKMNILNILYEPFIVHRHIRKNKRLRRIKELIKKVGLSEDILGKYPYELSGGERQRVNIARALSVEPKLLICDEPVSSLDLPIQAKILRLLAKLKKEENLALLFISHDPQLIELISDKVIRL